MAYDKTNRRLYVDTSTTPNKGISLHEIAACLQDYRRDTKGNVDLGMMCTSPMINNFAKNRPIPTFEQSGVLTEEERRSINYGFRIVGIAWNGASFAEETSWDLYHNSSATRKYYRVLDFNGYNHFSQSPLQFSFPDGSRTYLQNTTFGVDFPDIIVKYRLNDSLYSSGMENTDLPLQYMKLEGLDSETVFGGSLPCVVSYNDEVGYRVANGTSKLGSVTSDTIDDVRIELSKFNIDEAAINAPSSDVALAPSGASNILSLTMYPKLNNYSDLSHSRPYSDDDSTPFGNVSWDDAKTTGNGFVRKISNAVIPVPDGSPLKIIRYTFVPATINYEYASVSEGGQSFVSTWMYDPLDAETIRPANLGGKTLHFSSETVRITVLAYFANIYDADIYIKPHSMSFLGRVTTNVELSTVTTDDSYLIAQGGATSMYITGTFEAGSSSDYTFGSYSDSEYGTTSCVITMKAGLTSDKFGDPMLFNSVQGTEVLRWQ